MDEHHRDTEPQDEVKLPEERVEDLEPDREDAGEVKGGRQVYQWWSKVEGGGSGG